MGEVSGQDPHLKTDYPVMSLSLSLPPLYSDLHLGYLPETPVLQDELTIPLVGPFPTLRYTTHLSHSPRVTPIPGCTSESTHFSTIFPVVFRPNRPTLLSDGSLTTLTPSEPYHTHTRTYVHKRRTHSLQTISTLIRTSPLVSRSTHP